MSWVFPVFLAASIAHMTEEYFFPGGFMKVMKEFRPRYARFVTVPMAIIINGLQLVLCVAAIVVGTTNLAFSMSIAALLFINGFIHIVSSIRLKVYVPGVITGALLYIPLATYSYIVFSKAGQLTTVGMIVSVASGVLYQIVPMAYLELASRIRHS